MKFRLYIIATVCTLLLLSSNTSYAYLINWYEFPVSNNYSRSVYGGTGSSIVSPSTSTTSSQVLLKSWQQGNYPDDGDLLGHWELNYYGKFQFESEFGNTDPVNLTLSATNFGLAFGTTSALGYAKGGLSWECHIEKSGGGVILSWVTANSSEYAINQYENLNLVFDDYHVYNITLTPGGLYTFSVELDIWTGMNSGTTSANLTNGYGTGIDGSGVDFLFNLPQESAAVPIPSALWLLGSGLIGIVGIRRKFKETIK